MTRRNIDNWLYQRLALTGLAAIFTIYSLLIGVPLHVIAMVLPCVVLGIASPRRFCIAIPITKYVYVNYCGALLPLLISIVVLVQSALPWYYALLITSLSIALSALHTYVSKNYVLVNVPRYLVAVTSTTLALLEPNITYTLLPFVIVIGIIIGSDLFSYLAIRVTHKSRKSLVIGGLMALDSISLSLLFSLTILTVIRMLYALVLAE